MTFASWINVVIANSRAAVVYRVWKAVASLLTGDMTGTWTVIGTSAGASPGWTGDADPADGAWVLLECQTANADASKMQVFVGYRSTSGALAGFGTKAAGLYVAVSPIGGWDAVNYWFGASLADWRNGSIKTVAGYTSAAILALVITAGDAVNHRPGSLYVLTRQGSGAQAYCIGAGMAIPPTGAAVAKTRCWISAGAFDFNATGGWHNDGTILFCKTTADGWDNGRVWIPDHSANYSEPCLAIDAESGQFVQTPVPCWDTTLAKSRGYLESPSRVSAADGDLNGVVGSADRWVWGGHSWPREPARDGSWV